MSRTRRFLVASGIVVVVVAALVPGGMARTEGGPFYVVPVRTTKQCANVGHCVGVTGPWVVIPARGQATFLHGCVDRYSSIVVGTDARASSSHVQVSFDGQLGAPLGAPNSPTTTGAALLFHAVTDNGKPGSFSPVVGCVPLKQSSSRSTVSARVLPGAPPGAPLDLHAVLFQLAPNTPVYKQRLRCPKHEKLVGSWHALAYLVGPPDLVHIDALLFNSRVENDNLLIASIQPKYQLFSTAGGYPEIQVGIMCQAPPSD